MKRCGTCSGCHLLISMIWDGEHDHLTLADVRRIADTELPCTEAGNPVSDGARARASAAVQMANAMLRRNE